MLGVIWNIEDLFKPDVRPDAGVRELVTPLSTVIDGNLLKGLRGFIQRAKDEQGRPIKELGALPKEEFLDWYRRAAFNPKAETEE